MDDEERREVLNEADKIYDVKELSPQSTLLQS